MNRCYTYSIMLIMFVSSLVFAQTGKIKGRVLDKNSKEHLIGANVIIEGTSYGSTTDVEGSFIILNVPAGNYKLKATYVGYSPVTISNIRVSSQLTTEIEFELLPEDIQLQAVEIIAERPLINRNATNAVRTTTGEEIKNIPIRGIENIVSLMPGVVQQNGNIYIRGGRLEQVGYIVEGIQTRNVLFGGNTVIINDNAIGEVQVHSGGYNAEYGWANAGIIFSSLQTGSEKYKFMGEIITDGWAATGKKQFGTYSYGYNEYNFSLSGPLPFLHDVKFFISGRNQFSRSVPKRWDGVNLRGLVDITAGNQTPVDIIYPAGKMLNNADNRWSFNGNLMTDIKVLDRKFNMKLSGWYSKITQFGNGGNTPAFRGADIDQIFNTVRLPLTEVTNSAAILKITHSLTSSTVITVNFGYNRYFWETMDPYLREKWWLYGDSLENAKYGFTLRGDGEDPQHVILFGTQFSGYGTIETGYQKVKVETYSAKGDITHQIGKTHEIRAGLDYTQYIIRSWALAGDFCMSYSKTVKNNPNLTPFDILKSVRLSNYGYDFMGQKEVDDISGHPGFKPRRPEFAAAFIQDKIELGDLVINAGLRYDYMDIDQRVPKDPGNIPYDADGLMDYRQFVRVRAREYVSPRLGFSFSLSDQTVFHAQWGRFIQQSRLRDIYLGHIAASVNIKGGNAIQNNIGWGLRPERTTQYELGFNQVLTENSAFDITVYYRDIVDQVQSRMTPRKEGANHQSYFSFVNGDFATTKGIEFTFTLRRTNRISAQAYYSYSDARGTGSNSASAFRTIWQSPTGNPFFPTYVVPVDYNQPHRGSVNIDYRWDKGEGGPILEQLGLNLLFTFNSGHSFTRIGPQYGNTRIPTEELNASYTPWNYQFDLRVDKSFKIGPFDANVYLWIINLFDTKNVQNVFLQTGAPDDDGYLNTPSGKNDVDTYGEQFAQLYRAFLANGYGFEQGFPVYHDIWGVPRQIRLGLRIEY